MSFDEWDDWEDEPGPAAQTNSAEVAEITAEFRKYLIDLVDEKVRSNLNDKLERNTDFVRFMDYYYKVGARHLAITLSLTQFITLLLTHPLLTHTHLLVH